MADFEKLRSTLDAALTQAAEESSMLLGQTLSIAPGDSLKSDRESYLSGMEDAIFVAAVESREDYPGQLRLAFSLRDAILLSGLLLGIPQARISEKRKLAILEPDDCDAFAEILNQLIGSFNSVFKPAFAGKVHLKLLSPRKFVPGIDEVTAEEPFPEGPFLLHRANLSMPEGMEMDRLDLLVSLDLANLFDPSQEQPAVADAAPTETAAEAGPAPPPAETPVEERIVLLADDPAERQELLQQLSGLGLQVVDDSFGGDLAALLRGGGTRVAVVGVARGQERELSVCATLTAINRSLPLIICSREWTKTGVLRALKYGARDILVQPCTADEIHAKVKKALKAA